MPTADNPTVSVFGYSTAEGVLANLVDGDETTFWRPYADGFDSYGTPPISDAGIVLPGYPRPAIQFDFGDRVRIPIFRTKTEGRTSLPPCWLFASDLPASSTSDTVQAGDLYAGFFTLAQMNNPTSTQTLANNQEIRGRYWRFVSIITPPAA
jgi:hypothetical protein